MAITLKREEEEGGNIHIKWQRKERERKGGMQETYVGNAWNNEERRKMRQKEDQRPKKKKNEV